MDEDKIVEEIKNGNNEAFNALYEEYYLKLYNYIFGKMDNKANTDDLVQIAFVKIYRNIGKYDKSKSTFYKFMLANCNQVVADYYTKKERRNNIAENVELDEEKLGEEAIDFNDLELDEYNVKAVMKFLTDEQKKAFRLIHFKHMTIKEAAEKMGKTESSIKSLVFRSRQVMREKIAEENPDVAKKYGYIRLLKLIIIAAVCFALIGGFAYAIYRIYIEYTKKETYTLEDVRRELPDEESEISREEATAKMNEYLEILGMDEKVNEEDISLRKNYMVLKNCWEYNSENCKISIDSISGRLLIYSCLNEEKIFSNTKYDDVINKLNLIDGYELYSDELVGNYRSLQYEKKYGDVYNPYQKVLITCRNEIIITITIFDFYYEDKEVLIDKQQAIIIAEENAINVQNIELVIENIDLNELRDKQFNIDVSENLDNSEMIFYNINIRQVWKILDEDNRICYIDVNTGELYKYDEQYQMDKSN